ncbi:alkaline phosphatase PhoX [Catellatospora sp. NPDC049609]|uniref:alkaline phosphatase PhoX n=1 Tax=Catellatospora sp. NPDC049609 TaxID=3155505 RepID=UPI003437F6BB
MHESSPDRPGSLPLSRRHLLRTGTLGGLGIALAGSVQAVAGPAYARSSGPGYGPLVPDPAGLLALPEGFSYRIVAESGRTVLASGEVTPSDPDGTACFPARHGFTLVNNHEIDGGEPYGVPPLKGLTFDPGALGGTTTIDVDRHGRRLREYVSLAGTHNNCAGGVTPWGTWLTCEETEQRAEGPFQQDHGWVFEVDPFDAAANADPVPLRFLGRYAHEAVAVDPQTGRIYLTEDARTPNGLFLRWLPPRGHRGGRGALRRLALGKGGDTAGRLQALRATRDGVPVGDLSEATTPGTTYVATWVDVPDRLAVGTSVRRQFSGDEVTRAHKLEGQWWGDGGAYFVSSYARLDDGALAEHDGQVWFHDPRRGTIELKTVFGVNPDPKSGYDGPDNITVSPYGGVILAEDGAGLSHLVGVTDDGDIYPLGRNETGEGEFAGPTFSQDGRILFAAIQSPGLVLAITGPWRRHR